MKWRGFGLVETLAALAITGGLLAILSGVLYQAAQTADRQETLRTQAETEAALRLLLQARLDAIELVASPERLRAPHFEIDDHSLVFVTRFSPPAPLLGLWEVRLEARDNRLDVTLEDWPDARQRETLGFDLPGVRFAPQDFGLVVEGLPRSIVIDLPSGPAQLSLGAQLPLDCVIAIGAVAQELGGLLCPGQGL